MTLHDLVPKGIDGAAHPLAKYKGKVALVVNTASECGFTPQLGDLQRLWDEYQGRGLVVLGFPSNEFGAQEPGNGKEIVEFCAKNYGVSFPLFEKIETKGGEGQSPVYKFLTEGRGEPKWNFHKYLVGRDGVVIAEYPSNVSPTGKTIKQAIDAALGG